MLNEGKKSGLAMSDGADAKKLMNKRRKTHSSAKRDGAARTGILSSAFANTIPAFGRTTFTCSVPAHVEFKGKPIHKMKKESRFYNIVSTGTGVRFEKGGRL